MIGGLFSAVWELVPFALLVAAGATWFFWPRFKDEWDEAGRVYRAGELDSGIPARTPLPSLPGDCVEFESGFEGRADSLLPMGKSVTGEPQDVEVGPLSHCKKVPRLYDWEADLWMGLEDVQ